MSRRSGSETRIRTIALATRWSPDELRRLDDIAKLEGCSRAAVLRRLVAHDHRNIIPSLDLGKDIRRIGNNINQLTRAVNAGKPIPRNNLEQVYREMLAALCEMRR